MREKIIFFGSGMYVLPIIEILSNQFDLDLVVTTEKQPTDPVVNYCKKMGLQFISVTTLKGFNDKVDTKNYKLAVLASFGLIVRDEVLT